MKRIILALLLLNLAMPVYAADSYLDGEQLLSKCNVPYTHLTLPTTHTD